MEDELLLVCGSPGTEKPVEASPANTDLNSSSETISKNVTTSDNKA
jgi:hypothetical protein